MVAYKKGKSNFELQFAGLIIRKSIFFKPIQCENQSKVKLILSVNLQSKTARWYQKGNKSDT